MNSKILTWAASATAIFLVGLFLVWFLFLKPAAPEQKAGTTTPGLSAGTIKTIGNTTASTNTNGTQNVAPAVSKQKVFKIAEGPVTGAAFIQTLYPTTTLVRYVLQENGHVLDSVLDTPGSLPRAKSNTTIPGTARAVWGRSGNAAYLQYIDGTTMKTVSLLFSAATSSKSVTRPVDIQFFPDNIVDIAASPDGNRVIYLLPGAGGGVNGYTANPDATEGRLLFSLPLSEVLVSWPAQSTILAQTRSSTSAPGILFSVDVKNGSVVPLISASGLTATADRSFSSLVYQSSVPGEPARLSYVRTTKTGLTSALSYDPIPEKCAWGNTASSTLYCGLPFKFVAANYLDLWHMGEAASADSILSFTINPGKLNQTAQVAQPGTADGGEVSDIIDLAVSPDDKYLLFIKRGDRSLWGVRINQ